MREPNSINVFLYRMSKAKREYLLFKRTAQPELALPAFWQGITGGMETGETLEETAQREVHEESGIIVLNLLSSEYFYEYPIKDEWRAKYSKDTLFIKEYVYSARIEKDPVLSSEHNEFGWFDLEKAMELLSFGNNKEALTQVEASLNA